MSFSALWRFVALSVMIAAPLRAIDLRQRSESGNKQFVVYSDDIRLRQRVASFAEEVKTGMLQVLGESDLWKAPIVITLARASAADETGPAARLRVAETQPGFKVEINVEIGDDPAAANLHKVVLRALLLEYSYRSTGITAGEAVVEPPWWIVEGMLEMDRRRQNGTDSSLFQRLVEANRLPPLESFLAKKPDELGPTALAVDRSLAMCLLELLIDQSDGRASLRALLRDWPQSDGDPATLLARNFQRLGTGATLQKWWTLSLARFAAMDRYQALSAEETEKALAPLLVLDVMLKGGEKKSFALAEYPEYLKLPAIRAILEARRNEVIALSTRANVLYRPVVADYEEILALLTRGKTRGMRERLAKAEEFRRGAFERVTQIADYLNWFEATQMQTRSGVFDDYLKTAREISEEDQKHTGPVGRYLDDLEREF